MTKTPLAARPILPGLLWLCLSAAASTAFAQTAGSLGGGPGKGPYLTREELRACMVEKDRLATERDRVDAEQKALEAEKDAIATERSTLLAEEDTVLKANEEIKALNQRTTALDQRVKAWNERAAAFKTAELSADEKARERAWLTQEQADIQKETTALKADQDRFSTSQGTPVATRNARKVALNQRIEAWNQRLTTSQAAADKYQDDREAWKGDCGDRRYLIVDEKAIKAGQ